MEPKYIGVLYAPFQSSSLQQAHRDAIAELLKSFSTVVIALPVRKVTPTKNAPLSFAARESMIRSYLSNNSRYVYIVPVVDRKYPQSQVSAFEKAVQAPFSEPVKAVVYTTEDFGKQIYKAHGGKWTLHLNTRNSYLIQEAENRANALEKMTLNEDFRTGVIHGMLSQYPISWPTIDMAIRREIVKDQHAAVAYLFGKKPGENGWRFAGGFKDRTDLTMEDAVYREGGEEVLKKGVNPKDVFDYPRYICSRNVNDWRYRNETDGITTFFYLVNYRGAEDQIKAGDDLCDAAWLTLQEARMEGIEGEHIFLVEALEKFEVQGQYCQRCHTEVTCDCGAITKGQMQDSRFDHPEK